MLKFVRLVAAMAAFSFMAPVSAQTNVFSVVVSNGVFSPPAENLRTYLVSLNTEAMRAGASSMTLNPPVGSTEVVHLIRFEARAGYVPVDTDGDGDSELVPDPNASPEQISWFWYGKSATWTVSATMEQGVLAGRIASANVRFSLTPKAGGQTELGWVNTQYWRNHDGDTEAGAAASTSALLPVRYEQEQRPAGEWMSQISSISGEWDTSCSAPLSQAPSVIDVLVLYTSGVYEFYNFNHAAVRAVVRSVVDGANMSIWNSGIRTIHVQLRNVEPVPGSFNYDGQNIVNALEHLGGWASSTTSPYMTFPGNASVLARRNENEADVVALARRSSDSSCGYSLIQDVHSNGYAREPGPEFEKFSYMVFRPECDADRLNFTHELGHLLGMDHDPRNADVDSVRSCPWSFGHRRADLANTSLRFRTVMSYWEAGNTSNPPHGYGPRGCSNSNDCPLIDAFSTPGLEFNGSGMFPLGTFPGSPEIGVPAPTTDWKAARGVDTLQRLAPIVRDFRGRADQIFRDHFQ